jgi:lysophospholipase L1-like esterase
MNVVGRRPTSTVLLVLSLCLNALVVVGAAAFVYKKGGTSYLRAKYYETFVRSPYGESGQPFHESSAFNREISIFDLVPVEPGDVVFLGDSHAQYALWSEAFASARVRNRGIAGDNAEGVLARLEPVIAGRPAAVFLMVGSNDVDARLLGATVEDTAAKIGRIVDRIRTGSPETAVYILSAPPKSRNSQMNVTETPLALRLNELFATLAPTHGATYLDIAAPLQAEDGSLEIEFTYDGGHLNGEGYRRVIEVVRPYVERHLAEGS